MQKPRADHDIELFIAQSVEGRLSILDLAGNPQYPANYFPFVDVSLARLESNEASERQIGQVFNQPAIVTTDVRDRHQSHLGQRKILNQGLPDERAKILDSTGEAFL